MDAKPHSEGQLALQRVIERLQPHFAELEAFLRDQVSAFEPEVQPLVEYTLGHSGKKLRPMLVFLAGAGDSETPKPELVKAAAIVELVHLATLVHDDILDEADMRHRTETVVAKYGDHAAVLLGDALFAHALKLAADFDGSQVCRIVAESTRQVCSGEIAQTFARGESDLSLERYFRMIDLKTAELFVASAYLGALLGDGRTEVIDAAKTFARHLGIAFQVYDDLADLLSNEAKAGKTLGTDLATGKFTLPFLLWFETLEEAEVQQTLAGLKSGEIPVEAVLEKIRTAGKIEASVKRFQEELLRARQVLEGSSNWLGAEELPRLLVYLEEAAEKLLKP